jgi:hypothetical protein
MAIGWQDAIKSEAIDRFEAPSGLIPLLLIRFDHVVGMAGLKLSALSLACAFCCFGPPFSNLLLASPTAHRGIGPKVYDLKKISWARGD